MQVYIDQAAGIVADYQGCLRTEVTGMCGIGPFWQGQKLIMTIWAYALTVGALITSITHLATGRSEWPFYALCVLAGTFMTDWIRKAPIKEARR
ncbi:hypothetical protein G205_23354 [Arthrobacter nitrophenolicus]|uniref:Uncharacterized protein n=3 Tax=Micrococcaceae TaxID=1268 RepID=L8TLU7_9MICC|nr:hypothetical protein Achl_4582 [Pseudarthrobacter chlorophenolicus A6]ELT42616.1 hypothetical protein G205_23354 [Arthrobacter nitrophenolicus]SDQ10613.1 hypothetical protein SAMN04489738_0147 [Pseudarthrobacter chlorophenolicus]